MRKRKSIIALIIVAAVFVLVMTSCNPNEDISSQSAGESVAASDNSLIESGIDESSTTEESTTDDSSVDIIQESSLANVSSIEEYSLSDDVSSLTSEEEQQLKDEMLDLIDGLKFNESH